MGRLHLPTDSQRLDRRAPRGQKTSYVKEFTFRSNEGKCKIPAMSRNDSSIVKSEGTSMTYAQLTVCKDEPSDRMVDQVSKIFTAERAKVPVVQGSASRNETAVHEAKPMKSKERKK